ncbi:oligosaccharide flippase family protein [Candidatus Poribacteria bacterium]|nr:oligosaccharide flippase family protein [Candidatus Poribacteria bacterium]
MHKIWQKIFYTSSSQIYSLFIGIIIITLTARWLGPEGRGTIAAVMGWIGLFSSIGYFSLGQVAIYRATQLRNQEWLSPTFGSLLFIDLIVTLLGWCIASILYLATKGTFFNGLPPLLLIIGFISLPLMIWEQYGSSLLMAIDKIAIYNYGQILGRTIGLILIIIAWRLKWGLPGVLVSMVIAQSVVSLTGLFYLFNKLAKSIKIDKTTIKELLKGGIKLHFNYVGAYLIGSVSILIINHHQGVNETGYYQLASQLISIMAIIPQAASMVIHSTVTQFGTDASWGHQRKIVLYLMLGMIGIGILAFILAPWVIPFVLGNKFIPAIKLFRTLLFSLFGSALATIMNPQWVGRGLFGIMSTITIALGIISVIMNLILVPKYGVYGAAWTMIGIYVLASIPQIWLILDCELKYKKK